MNKEKIEVLTQGNIITAYTVITEMINSSQMSRGWLQPLCDVQEILCSEINDSIIKEMIT